MCSSLWLLYFSFYSPISLAWKKKNLSIQHLKKGRNDWPDPALCYVVSIILCKMNLVGGGGGGGSQSLTCFIFILHVRGLWDFCGNEGVTLVRVRILKVSRETLFKVYYAYCKWHAVLFHMWSWWKSTELSWVRDWRGSFCFGSTAHEMLSPSPNAHACGVCT